MSVRTMKPMKMMAKTNRLSDIILLYEFQDEAATEDARVPRHAENMDLSNDNGKIARQV